jgi:hypothetical protein
MGDVTYIYIHITHNKDVSQLQETIPQLSLTNYTTRKKKRPLSSIYYSGLHLSLHLGPH